MTCVKINNGIICFSKTDFKCPHCNCLHNETKQIEQRMNKNKSNITKIKCKQCSKVFSVTFDYKGNNRTFK